MAYTFRRLLLCPLIVIALLPLSTFADTFEFLTYTPPPGWRKESANDETIYKRPNSIGLIYFYNSYPTTSPASDEFAKIWRAKVEPTVPGSAPQPLTQREGDYMVALGGKEVNAQGTMTTIGVAAIVGKGRAIGVLTMAAGDEVLREVTAFLGSIDVSPVPLGAASAGAGTSEVEFQVPPGYVSQRDGSMIVIKPKTLDQKNPCIYGIGPARPSKGSLEADARAAMLEALPGWQFKNDHYNAMRGTSGDGWPYYWFRTDVQQMSGGQMQYLAAMTMAFPNGPGQVSIVWGFGGTSTCTLDDLPFIRLFFSLRPSGSASDGGKTFARELQGTWRNTEYAGMAQYRFFPNGRYEYGQGTSTTFGVRETRTGSISDGNFALKESELTITPDSRRGPRRFRARIYDELSGGIWLRRLSLLDEGSSPPLEIRYMRVTDSQ